jgi:DNA polymerase III alpha subunit
MLPLGNYLFNRSHSSTYGLQAYQDMFLKIHWPVAFYAALLTTTKKTKKEDKQDFLRAVLREARVFEIEAVPPDINRSERGWNIDRGRLRYGLVSINGLGGGLVNEVIEHRPFKRYRHFVIKMPSTFGSDKMVALAKAGAFDATDKRAHLLSRVRKWDDGVAKLSLKMSCGHLKSKTVKLKKDSDGDLEAAIAGALEDIECKHHPDAEIVEVKRADDTEEVARFYKDHPDSDPDIIAEPTDAEIADMEMEALNISLSQGSVALRYKPFIDARVYTEDEIKELPDKPPKKGKKHGNFCNCNDCSASECIVGGEVVNVKVIKTKQRQEEMAFVDVAHGVNQYNCTLFPYAYRQFHQLLDRPTALLFAGHKDRKGSILVNEVVDVVELAKAKGWEPEKVVSLQQARVKKKSIKTVKLKRRASNAGKLKRKVAYAG